ncbi:acyl-CoA dehydrogenase family protein [Nocardia sp. NPDC057272]|uniref:acyl-CoA dehydrogenase family protein n=1 Tax=Nocardia sp. NPDC057272 TaxID=3346079 RepID=UPI0036340929
MTTALSEEIRAWLAANAPGRDEVPAPGTPEFVAFAQAFLGRVYDAGFSGISWPVEYGGRGLGQPEEKAFWSEAAAYDLPLGAVFGIGLGMCGPIVRELGTEEQRQRYLRPLLQGREVWCQLFSEPAAGSDLAALRTRAVSDGDDFVITGQKVWTTGAHYCDFGILLARTDPDVPKHRGLTMFIVPMREQGVTVRPLRDMTGASDFNEVFFDGLRVPASAVVGGVGGGWKAARTLLVLERLAVSAGLGVDNAAEGPLSFGGLAGRVRARGLLDSPLVADQLVDLYLAARAADLTDEKLAQEIDAGIDPGSRGSIGKLLKARLNCVAADLAVDLLGDADLDEDLRHDILQSRKLAIGGGTDEIQLTIIGERVLGLPREPQADLAVPFRDLPAN